MKSYIKKFFSSGSSSKEIAIVSRSHGDDILDVEVVPSPLQTWEVRWTAIKKDYPFNKNFPEVVVFTSMDAAEDFATSLRQAFTLIRYTGQVTTEVTVSRGTAC